MLPFGDEKTREKNTRASPAAHLLSPMSPSIKPCPRADPAEAEGGDVPVNGAGALACRTDTHLKIVSSSSSSTHPALCGGVGGGCVATTSTQQSRKKEKKKKRKTDQRDCLGMAIKHPNYGPRGQHHQQRLRSLPQRCTSPHPPRASVRAYTCAYLLSSSGSVDTASRS